MISRHSTERRSLAGKHNGGDDGVIDRRSGGFDEERSVRVLASTVSVMFAGSMSWRGRDERRGRPRSPIWERPERQDRGDRERPERERPDRDRRYDRDRDERRERHSRSRSRDRSSHGRLRPERTERLDRPGRARRRSVSRSPPAAPSPPHISTRSSSAGSRSARSASRSPSRSPNRPAPSASPGDWFCKCGSYNFKRRNVCFRRHCQGKRSEGVIYGGDDRQAENGSGITKRLLFRRLDALTTEEKILEAIKDRCSKAVLDSIVGITIGRETLTGASKCLAYINFNSIADSTAAHAELLALRPPLAIDGRDVLVSFYYNDVNKFKNTDYSSYYGSSYAGAPSAGVATGATSAALSEADRVNAAAAVAHSAISAAAARHHAPLPTPLPTPPTGDGVTVFSPPDVRTFLYDETSGYYYDPATGLYYDGATQYFYNGRTTQYMYWDAASRTYIAVAQNQRTVERPKLPDPPEATTENTIAKEPEEKKKKENKEDKVKVAKKIAKDMERWARTLNQKKENARSNVVMEQPLDTAASKGSADIGFTVLGAGPVRETVTGPIAAAALIREVSPPVELFAPPPDDDEGIIDWTKLACLLCKRRFPSAEVLAKHKTMSDLHKANLAEFRKTVPSSAGYRDRAAERRLKFGEEEGPRPRPVLPAPLPPQPAPPPSALHSIGGKMLQKMGWSEGRGLGKTEQGRVNPVEAERRPALVGLGQKRGIYTPTPGETYRDTVKKLMIARYKEVVGQEDLDK